MQDLRDIPTKLTSASRVQVTAGVATALTAGGIDLFAHLGPTGLVIGGLAALVAWRHAPDFFGQAEDVPLLPASTEVAQYQSGKRNFADRLLGRYPGECVVSPNDDREIPKGEDTAVYGDEDEEDDLVSPRSDVFQFSEVLTDFMPSLQQIYLATLPDGTPVYSDAKGLCHVALAGATGGGKSNIVRLLMSQLCKARASVLLLNPHYTRYDLENDEDWTPFEPYLVYDPMECRKYEVIEHYLKQVATVLLPKRLEKYAHSQPVGKPYFLVIDELPAIVDNIPDAPKYLAKILREGRKVGIFLITAAQDFLVKTIAPQGGGAIRDCYRTAFYVGGDPTTAKVLLDIPANQIQEGCLGKGIVMLRNLAIKLATLAHIPYVDNEALYRLLGPSTYVPEDSMWEDDHFLEERPPTFAQPQGIPDLFPNPNRSLSQRNPDGIPRLELLPEREAVNVVNAPVKHGEDVVNIHQAGECEIGVSPAEEARILDAAFKLLEETSKVTRTGIRDRLGWNNKQYPKIQYVCDKYDIAS